MKPVIRFGIRVRLVLDAVRFQRGFVFGPPFVDVGILFGKMKQQRGLDLRHVFDSRRGAIEGNAGRQPRHAHSDPVHHAAAEAEADGAKLAGGLRMLKQEVRRREKIFRDLPGVELLLHLACLIVRVGRCTCRHSDNRLTAKSRPVQTP